MRRTDWHSFADWRHPVVEDIQETRNKRLRHAPRRIDLETMFSKAIARAENLPVHHKTMKLLTRLLVLMIATLLLLLALVVISVFVLISGIRWLVTGKKPSFVLYVQAFQRFKNSTNRAGKYRPSQNDIIDAEFREVKGDSDRLQ